MLKLALDHAPLALGLYVVGTCQLISTNNLQSQMLFKVVPSMLAFLTVVGAATRL